VNDFERGDWEDSIVKFAKFIEAILKSLAIHCGISFEQGRKFKVDAVINALGQLPSNSHNDALRLLIPRVCRAVYDLASNRGARHDPDEIDPNSMDAHLAVHASSWILAEAIRYAQSGAVNPAEAKEYVESLTEKKYPLMEDIEGRIYFHADKKSAPDVALAILAKKHPRRVHKDVLVDMVRKNHFSLKNAQITLKRISKYVDDDGNGNLRLLAPGLKRAEEIIKQAIQQGKI